MVNFFLYLEVLNIITRKTLLKYIENHPQAATGLLEWYHNIQKSDFKSFNELKIAYGNASLVGDDRVVFNITGNNYRLVVRIIFDFKVVQIKWFVTHKEYDKIDVTTVAFKEK